MQAASRRVHRQASAWACWWPPGSSIGLLLPKVADGVRAGPAPTLPALLANNDLQPPLQQGLLLLHSHGAVQVHKVFCHSLEVFGKHHLQEHPFLGVAENSGVALGVVVNVFLVGLGHVAPVDVGLVVMDHVVVLIPNVVVPFQDGERVDVLVVWVGLLHKSMPEVGDGAQESYRLSVRVQPVEEAERSVPLPEHESNAVVVDHAVDLLRKEVPLLALRKQHHAADASPVQHEPWHVDEEGAGQRAVQVQVRVQVTDIVVPAVVDLHVSNGEAVGHHPVEGGAPPLDKGIEDLERCLEEALVIMTSLVDEGVGMAKKLEARANAQDVVKGQRGELQAELVVTPHGPGENTGRVEAEDRHPWNV
mmetsp:Transcript_75053/g.169925  ORF Transcript_75053/g.169925 Transcript_75053/m.169925 type:complete len:363 (+) Transcript_75053:232-1320(+)